jgi:hypothetical protein
MKKSDFVQSASIGIATGGLFVFGVTYAYWVSFKHHSDPRNTWRLVVGGDAATDLGSAMILLVATKRPGIAIIPVLAHILTGLPMIVAQVMKYKQQDKKNSVILSRYKNNRVYRDHSKRMAQ